MTWLMVVAAGFFTSIQPFSRVYYINDLNLVSYVAFDDIDLYRCHYEAYAFWDNEWYYLQAGWLNHGQFLAEGNFIPKLGCYNDGFIHHLTVDSYKMRLFGINVNPAFVRLPVVMR